MADPRTVKTKLPLTAIVSASVIGVLVLAFIIFAVWSTGRGVMDSKLAGTVISKEFRPLKEEQVTVGKDGKITQINKDGEYVLTVEAADSSGVKKQYWVWVSKEVFDKFKIGDSYDVGPALVRSPK